MIGFPASSRLRVLLALVALGSGGCSRVGRVETLVVATSLDRAACDRVTAAYHRSLETKGEIPLALRFVTSAPGVEPPEMLERGWSTDVLLGGSAAGYERASDHDDLLTIAPNERRPWRVVGRDSVGEVASTGRSDRNVPELPLLDDPRRSAVSFASADAVLRSRGWGAGYRELMQSAGRPGPLGVDQGDAVAKVVAGKTSSAAALSSASSNQLRFTPTDPTTLWFDGVAVSKHSPRASAARRFVESLVEQGIATEPPRIKDEPERGLIADLLGAVLVEAQPELAEAFHAVSAASQTDKSKATAWLEEPPPWPPASIQKLKASADGPALVESLAEQAVPDLAARVWLVESWEQAPRTVDRELLHEIATAAGGKLAAEPRFRAWLASEWSAWARQRFRRIAREARP